MSIVSGTQPPTTRKRGNVHERSRRRVFENDFVEELAMRYKRDHEFGVFVEICRQSKNLIDSIIIGSGYNRHHAFHDICAHLFLQIERWIIKWVPGNGALYSYLSQCCKHGCISYVSKESQYRQRQILMGDAPMESLGAVYTQDFSSDPELVKAIHARISVRWSDHEIREAINYAVEEVLEGIPNRKIALQTMAFAFPGIGVHVEPGVSRDETVEVAKFLLDWASAAVRSAYLDLRCPPISENDVLRLQNRYSFLPDLVGIVGAAQAAKVITAFGGMSIRFPSVSTLTRTKQLVKAYDAWTKSPGPDTIKHWASKTKIPTGRLEEMLTAWAGNIRAGVLEDVSLDELTLDQS